MRVKKFLCICLCLVFSFVVYGCGSKNVSKAAHGLWLASEENEDGELFSLYFMDDETILIGEVSSEMKKEDDYYIKGCPYEYSIPDSSTVKLKAGYSYGSEIAEDEIRDGIPQLEYKNGSLYASGGEIDGMSFDYVKDDVRYEVDN